MATLLDSPAKPIPFKRHFPKSHSICIRLHEDDLQKLQRLAEIHRTSMSSIVRELIRAVEIEE